jgi:hypothetical protein
MPKLENSVSRIAKLYEIGLVKSCFLVINML